MKPDGPSLMKTSLNRLMQYCIKWCSVNKKRNSSNIAVNDAVLQQNDAIFKYTFEYCNKLVQYTLRHDIICAILYQCYNKLLKYCFRRCNPVARLVCSWYRIATTNAILKQWRNRCLIYNNIAASYYTATNECKTLHQSEKIQRKVFKRMM